MNRASKDSLYLIILILILFIIFILNYDLISDKIKTLTNKTDINLTSQATDNKDYLNPKGYLTTEVLNKKYYSVGYAEDARQAEWTSYILNRRMVEIASLMLKEKRVKRSNKFFKDLSLIGAKASLNDYFRSGYDRGHLVPSFDMSFSNESMVETYYLTNISPQEKGFNRGIWSKLERQVRNWALEKENIYIVGAGILTENKGYIGTNKVLVPKYFYKIIMSLDLNELNVISFIIPNENLEESSLTKYVVNVAEIEEKTKIDFFFKFNAKIKLIIKSKKDLKYWKLK